MPIHRAGLKISALVGGMVAGADSIADMAVLWYGGIGWLFTGMRATDHVADISAVAEVRACAGSWTLSPSPPGS